MAPGASCLTCSSSVMPKRSRLRPPTRLLSCWKNKAELPSVRTVPLTGMSPVPVLVSSRLLLPCPRLRSTGLPLRPQLIGLPPTLVTPNGTPQLPLLTPRAGKRKRKK
ncbi:uncharacterized protein PGTG_05390 [Puccinia graminis f. sp. tritici CRL 75-36-700-3]|uniref:Uncharacterized protein n=1 Tax=Puccinia graminis f. sp. tritici (strain CRL 75-36-700-3 / race SCCL) TaxID=418459 RepID=E3K6N1_PUCGT|nr:uncharacterized protein PGTG_05390 [Puccinia graminis f. sp. tritici CRL 75-36-700-3]EFP80165.2 hypothetical protein PGTG_05390 [Puccinia graminis f. sp. tritici CRL 75-36-700-3]